MSGLKIKSEAEIGSIGENFVAAKLRMDEWLVKVDTKLPGKTDIEAKGKNNKSLLIQVKTGVSPNKPTSLSREEEGAIKRRAGQLGYEAWEARVQLNDDYSLNEISWREL